MKLRAWFLRFTCLWLAALVSGCEHSFTYTLWHQDEFRHHREPATNPAVAVYYAPQRKDFLVAYNSLRDGDNTPRRQAYLLGDNQARVSEHKKPALVSTNRWPLVPVPINGATNVLPHARFDQRLTIHTETGDIGPEPLPTYPESTGTGAMVALTPLAVAGDVTCVGLILGFFAALAYAGGGGYWHCR